MIGISSLENNNFDNISVDPDWNFGDEKELKMHSIHAYPAKFPAFIASKAIEYAQGEGVNTTRIADIFCGCGTVALEAKLHNISFWGCDINPVATLIAKAKSNSYKISVLDSYYTKLHKYINSAVLPDRIYFCANERLQYWFTEESYLGLYKIKQAITHVIPNGKYNEAFSCILSAILKPSSKWLTKSIKPQVDPNKASVCVDELFKQQYERFIKAVKEIDNEVSNDIRIENANFLTKEALPKVDLIITSPPYVTSYEYADLHQLSALWLGYATDYRDLRCGSIGSVYNSETYKFDQNDLNNIGRHIVQQLTNKDGLTAKVKSVARYYLDMQIAINKSYHSIANNGMIFCVVGDTEYKGVRIENSKHLVQCLIDNGFKDIKISKRRISKKLLTPYRDSLGRFSSDSSQRQVYHEEFIISGRVKP